MQKWILSFLMVALLATPALAFKDVPPNHWAYDAINKAVEKGILQGYNNMFHGKKTLNRFQMAVVVARMLDKIGTGGGGVDKDALKQLEALVTEFADELALLNVKVGKLEETVAAGPRVVKAVRHEPMAAPGGVSLADGNLKIGGIFKNWYHVRDNDLAAGAAATDNNSFQLRNARLLFWHKLTDDIKIFVQTDHAGSAANNGDILDFKATIKMPNSENTINFGRFLAPITHYMHKGINKLDFIDYPIGVYHLGAYSAAGKVGFPYAVPADGAIAAGVPTATGLGIWRQDGLYFTFGEDTKFSLGVFDGNGANTGLAFDDEDKALMLKIEFKGSEKLDGAIWLWQDENTVAGGGAAPNYNEYDAMGLWVSYKHDSFDFMVEYITQEWTPVPAATVNESTSLMAQFIIPMTKDKTDFMLRYEDYDAEDQAGAAVAGLGDHERITLGFRWKMHDRAVWNLEYWSEEFDGGNIGAGAGNEPSSIVAQLMVWF